uniref:Uncharacterized protein n=1 Tax=Romanomermis culicivorax TaxID=13658 RepID=A0A915J219_ROMCU
MMTSESEVAMSQGSGMSTSLINPPPIFKKYINDQDRYVAIREKAALVKTSSMYDISQIDDGDDDESKMIPPKIIPLRYRISKKNKEDTSTPISTETATPVLEVKKDRLWEEHGELIRDIRAYQFSLFRRQNAIDRQLRTIQDYLESHPEDPNYVPPSEKRRDW